MLEKTLESPLDFKEVQPVHPKRDQPWILIGRTDAAAEAPILWLPDAKTDSLEKSLVLEKIEGRRRRGWQRMRWLDDITDSVDMIFGKLQAMVSDMEVWHAIIHGVAKSQTWLGDWIELNCVACGILFPWGRIKPMPPEVEAGSLNHWTAREIPNAIHCKKLCFLDRVVGLYVCVCVCVCVCL